MQSCEQRRESFKTPPEAQTDQAETGGRRRHCAVHRGRNSAAKVAGNSNDDGGRVRGLPQLRRRRLVRFRHDFSLIFVSQPELLCQRRGCLRAITLCMKISAVEIYSLVVIETHFFRLLAN